MICKKYMIHSKLFLQYNKLVTKHQVALNESILRGEYCCVQTKSIQYCVYNLNIFIAIYFHKFMVYNNLDIIYQLICLEKELEHGI